jgi:protein-S-isoprenylcysteine O-methyltransferase Ste14
MTELQVAFLKSVAYTILVPALIAWCGLPFLLALLFPQAVDLGNVRYVGLPILLAGLILHFICTLAFIRQGKGTPAIWLTGPIKSVVGESPAVVVSRGVYRFSRNPMYIAALLIVLGEAILSEKIIVMVYVAGLALFLHGLVVLYEEPHLRKTLGAGFQEYAKQTPRWL